MECASLGGDAGRDGRAYVTFLAMRDLLVDGALTTEELSATYVFASASVLAIVHRAQVSRLPVTEASSVVLLLEHPENGDSGVTSRLV